MTKESGSSTQRQASGTDTFNDSLEAIEIPVIALPGTYKVVADITCRLARHAVQPLLTMQGAKPRQLSQARMNITWAIV